MNEPEACVSALMRDDSQTPEISRLKRRADFQRAARGRRARMEAFALQANRRAAAPDGLGPRVGFTVTKKLGDAVLRNRIRRRLKEAVRLARDLETRPDHDYVVMAQKEALARPFALLQSDLIRAFSLVHSSAARSAPARPSNDRDKRR
ncbi:ribonuclease P protein component [Methylocapsa sp. S129]|uniref:ribonuclease P protein component n=1 Tax=Methylocapsa sp. S129 TaxID=1641869 RepID=UPI00131BECC2|nr:ribonuclease P protein component [Methylocapsa sp. S129]